MVTFRNKNNLRRNNFRRNERNFKSNGDRNKFSSNYSNSENFQRKTPGRNNHNAAKLIEKYNNLAREASSSGDKILSENYFQHADHFTRILKEKEGYKKDILEKKKLNENDLPNKEEKKIDNFSENKKEESDKLQFEIS